MQGMDVEEQGGGDNEAAGSEQVGASARIISGCICVPAAAAAAAAARCICSVLAHMRIHACMHLAGVSTAWYRRLRF